MTASLDDILAEAVRLCPQDCHLMCGGPDALAIVLAKFNRNLLNIVFHSCNTDLAWCAGQLARFVCNPSMHMCFALGYSSELLDACIASASGVVGHPIGAYIEEHNDPMRIFMMVVTAVIFWLALCYDPRRPVV
jgi:hypothetical protein